MERVDELLATLGLASRSHHRPDAMSGGEQQRVAIGRALINDPAVILADEPTGNLDSANSQSVCSLLRDLSVIHQKTIVMVTHEPSVAFYAQEVVVLKDGRLHRRFATRDLADAQMLAAAYQEVTPRACPACEAVVSRDDAFCHRCGARLAPLNDAPAVPPGDAAASPLISAPAASTPTSTT